jgi:FAST kinase domain-containing protein 2
LTNPYFLFFSSTLHTGQILQHPEFENLCYNVRSKAKFMELNEIIESLKILNFLGVSSKSEIVCILLSHIKMQINELSLGHIIFLEFLLRKYDNSNLVEALRMALPMLFQIQVNFKMDHENVHQLTELLMFISRYRVNEQCVTSVVTALTMHGKKIPVDLAASIIWSLTDIKKFQPMFEKLLQNCCKVLINGMKNKTVDYGTMERTLTRMVDKYTLRYPSFYNEEFLNTACTFTVEKNVGFTKTVYVLKKLNRIVSILLLNV